MTPVSLLTSLWSGCAVQYGNVPWLDVLQWHQRSWQQKKVACKSQLLVSKLFNNTAIISGALFQVRFNMTVELSFHKADGESMPMEEWCTTSEFAAAESNLVPAYSNSYSLQEFASDNTSKQSEHVFCSCQEPSLDAVSHWHTRTSDVTSL